LPFLSRRSKFEEYVKDLKKSNKLSAEEKNVEKEENWAKSSLKSSFAGGVMMISRVEGLHGVLRKYLTSKSSFQNIFYAFREVEDTQIERFTSQREALMSAKYCS